LAIVRIYIDDEVYFSFVGKRYYIHISMVKHICSKGKPQFIKLFIDIYNNSRVIFLVLGEVDELDLLKVVGKTKYVFS